jgi:hypothetical protein
MRMIHEEHAVETFKSIQAISLAGLKLLALFNGGAAVALLAYLGNIAGKGIMIPEMALPLKLYLFGLFFCGLAFLAGYATQLVLYNESVGRPPRWKSEWFQAAGVVLASLSLILFVVGSSVAAGRFPSGPVAGPCADMSV